MTKVYAQQLPNFHWFYRYILILLACWGSPQLLSAASADDDCNLEVSISSITDNCDDGATVCVKVSGGLAPYFINFDILNLTDQLSVGVEICFEHVRPGDYNITVKDLLGCTQTVTCHVPDHHAFDARVKPVTCYGGMDGAIDLDVPIDVAPIFYKWSGPDGFSADTQDIKNLKAGVYYVKVFGANGACYGVGKWEVTQPEPIKIDISIAQAVCNGAKVCAFVEGGTPPYRIWDFEELPPGIDNSNFTTAINFDQLDPSTAHPYNPTTTNSPHCVDDLPSGTYYVIVKDANGCLGWKIFRVNNAASFKQNITVKHVTCAGADDGKICFDINGGTPPYKTKLTMPDGDHQYTMEGAWGCFEHLRAGEYIVTTTDGSGCMATERVKINQPTPIDAEFILTGNNCADGASGCLKISGGTQPYRVFPWRHPHPGNDAGFEINFGSDGIPVIVGADHAPECNFPSDPGWNGLLCASHIPPGDYVLVIVDANNCYKIVVVHIPTTEIHANFEITSRSCTDGVSGCLYVEGGERPYNIYIWRWNSLLTVIPSVEFTSSGRPTLTGGQGQEASWDWDGDPSADPYRRCAHNIPPGDYYILVVDKNHCYKLILVHIPEMPGLQLHTRVKDVSCNGGKDGQIKLQIEGGEAPYTIYFGESPTTNNTPTDNATVIFDSLMAGVYVIRVVDKNGCEAKVRVEVKEPDPLMGEFVLDENNSCDGITGGCLRVKGGTRPYHFEVWDWRTPSDVLPDVHIDAETGVVSISGAVLTDLTLAPPTPTNTTWCFRNIPPGDYLILVKDTNGCYILIPVHIPPHNRLTVSAEATNPRCDSDEGGTVKVNISGGEAPYQISFAGETTTTSDTMVVFEDVAPGTYTIKVYDNRQCSAVTTVTVALPSINPNLVYAAYGDSACVAPTGGTEPYKIEWVNLEEGNVISTDSCVYNLEPGAYLVTIFDDAGCSVQKIVIIDPQPCYGGVAKVRPESIVSGEMVTFILSDYAGVNIQWQFKTEFTDWIDLPNATTDVYTTPMIITGTSKIIYVRAVVTCADGTVVYSTETSFKVRGDNHLRGMDAQVSDRSLFNPGLRIEALHRLGIKAPNITNQATVYPTVSQDVVQIRFDQAISSAVRITVLNELGRPMYQTQLDQVSTGETTSLSVSSWQPGMYFIRIEGDAIAETQRIVVR